MPPEPFALSLTEASAAISGGELSPVELVMSVLDRSDRVDSTLNAVEERFDERALAEARSLEREQVEGSLRGPLHGIPFAIKDTIDIKGSIARAGSRALPEVPATADATTVARLRSAGGIAVAKVATHELAFGTLTPKCRNPWDVGRYAGGSSGGSAVAVASGQACFGLGTDTGGSIRGPAAACGLVGMRPSYGLVPRTGIVTNSWSLDTVGPLAHTTADAAAVLEVLAGVGDHPVRGFRPVAYTDRICQPLEGLRLGLPTNYFFERVDGEVAAAVTAAAEVLSGLGATVEPIRAPGASLFMPTIRGIQGREISTVHKDLLQDRGHLLSDDVRERLEAASQVSADSYTQASQAREVLIQKWRRMFERIDALLTPTWPRVAPPIGTEVLEWQDGSEPVWQAFTRLMVPASLVGCPAISVPCGISSEDMPIGLQIIGRPGDDSTVMAIAHGFETETSRPVPAPTDQIARPRRWSP